MADLIHLRLDPKMRRAVKRVVQERYFSTESEFIRDSIRKNLDTYERVQALRQLQGTVPRRKTPGEPIADSEIFRAFGLPDPKVPQVARDDERSVPRSGAGVRLIRRRPSVRR